MKEITFNASTANGLFEARGVVILLPFDGGKHKAVLQFEIDGVQSETPALVDFKTGRIIASKDNLMAVKALNHVSYKCMTDCAAALIVWDKILKQSGTARVRSVLAGSPAVN